MLRHSFSVGQSVELVPGRLDGNVPRGTYIVLRLLPNDAPDREYRVKNARDGHERVMRESQLRRGPATLFSTRYAPHTGRHYDEADSEHPGLVNVCLADVRVRPINWNIDLATWNNLGNYQQGAPITHPDFLR